MNSWLEHIFPEFCPAQFDKLLAKLRHSDGKDQIQIFISLIDNKVTGLIQVLYQEWQGGLLSYIDLLGVLEPYRRRGFALSLVQRSLKASVEMARAYQVASIGVTTLANPDYDPIMRLHQKVGGQIRRDYRYSSGDLVVWYPMQKKYKGIATSILGDQLHLLGQLLINL
jgi:GNAT superfamily N-acetyltransferase